MSNKNLPVRITGQKIVKDLGTAIKMALPKYMEVERFARVMITEINKNPKLLECTTESLMGSILLSAQLGLEPGPMQLAYLIPYYNSKIKKKECQFQIGYRGYVKLAQNSGEVKTIRAVVVFEKDHFVHEEGLSPKLEHIPYMKKDKGESIACYTVADLKDGSKQFLVIYKPEMEKIRKCSQMSDGPAWSKWEDEMHRKGPVKRLCKVLPLSPEKKSYLAQDMTVKRYDPATKEIENETFSVLDLPDDMSWEDEGEPKGPEALKKANEENAADNLDKEEIKSKFITEPVEEFELKAKD